jgi:SAM-dependent methyltransferase
LAAITAPQPRLGLSPRDCHFYHAIELPSYGLQAGPVHWDLRGSFEEYTGGVPMSGRTMLDVGTASGFLTFEAEKRGTQATSFDLPDASVSADLPIRNSPYVTDYAGWRAQKEERIRRVHNSYWLSHEDLGSNARCLHGNIYDLSPEQVGTFDIVLVGQILIHLPDGLTALAAAASVCSDTLIITEGSYEADHPVAALAGRANRPELAYAWYQYSTGWYREALAMMGFTTTSLTKAAYKWLRPDMDSEWVELRTFVAHRTPDLGL